MGLLKNIRSIAKNRTTYRVGLLQAKAYRILKQQTMKVLEPHGISTFEWALLGLLADKGELRSLVLAEELGVEAPFVTVLVRKLSKQGLIIVVRGQKDSRVKMVSLTDEGKHFVKHTEPLVREKMRPLISGAGSRDILGYLATLESIIENEERVSARSRKRSD